MKLSILVATVALISVLCSACSGSRECLTRTFADIAVSYAAAGQSKQAIEFAQRIKSLTLKAEVLSQIALELVKLGQAQQAAEIFTQALEVARKIESPPDKVMALEAIATKYTKVGQKGKAAEVLSQALHSSKEIWGISFVKDTVLERIAVDYAKLGDYDQAIQVTNKIVDDIPKGRALARIVVQYVAAGEYNQARQVANTIEAPASKTNAWIEIAGKTGEYQQALSAAQKFDAQESLPLKIIVLGKIAVLYSKAGREKQAAEILSQALQGVKSIEDEASNARLLARIAIGYLEVGKKEQAVELSSQALQVARQLQDDTEKAVFFTRIAILYEQAGRTALANSIFADALEMAQTLDNEDKKARTLTDIAIASAQIKPYNQVVQLTQTIGNANAQASALTNIAKDYMRVGQKDQARQAFTQAFVSLQSSKNSKGKAQLLGEIAIRLAQIAQYEQALTVAQTLDATETDSPKASALAKIAGSYAKAGQKDKAIAILSEALQMVKATKCSY